MNKIINKNVQLVQENSSYQVRHSLEEDSTNFC